MRVYLYDSGREGSVSQKEEYARTLEVLNLFLGAGRIAI